MKQPAFERFFLRIFPMATPPALVLDQVSLNYKGRTVLRGADLRVARGEMVALCGGNGAGKTSLLKLANGDLRPHAGAVRHGKKDLRVAMVADRATLYDDWPVGVFLNWCAHGLAVADPSPLLCWVIAQCALQTVLEERCGALSHGYRQRVSLAQALVSSPDLLLLDEPANGLDICQQRALRATLKALSEHRGILFSHHDYGEVAALADRLYWLADGRCREIVLPAQGEDCLWARWRDSEDARKAMMIGGTCFGCYSAHPFSGEASRARLMAYLATDSPPLEIRAEMPAGALSTLLEIADG